MLCDLHTHSNYSDGTLPPEALVALAKSTGLKAVALCDHNTVAGLPVFMEAGQGSGVETVPGVEFSTEFNGKELHLIMLFVKPQDYGPISSLVAQFRMEKEKSNAALVHALQQSGIPVAYEDILKQAPDGYINRAHIAAELTGLGYASSVRDAFEKYLKPDGGFYVPPRRPDIFHVISFIRKLGGVSVLAHPLLNLSGDELYTFLPDAVDSGLDAMETVYSRYNSLQTALAKSLAQRFGLLESGGSDFHGTNKPDIFMGKGIGELRIGISVLDALKERNGKYI